MRVLIIKFIYRTYNKYVLEPPRHNKGDCYLDYYNLF